MKKKRKCERKHKTVAEIGKCKECNKRLKERFGIEIKVLSKITK